jgi:RsiW-degrading membrane proteinase PrsW (M82 family)
MELAIKILLALLPVTGFLLGLLYLDSYKLVRLREILLMIVFGGVAAVVAFGIHSLLVNNQIVSSSVLSRFVAPLIEETLKALPVYILIVRRQIGFAIDGAIFGFAVGAGFALVENLYYLSALEQSTFSLWIVRGFGTAVMHGCTTANFAMVAKTIADRKESTAPWTVLPALAICFAIHSLFNQFVLSPVTSAILVVIVFPPLLALVFAQSERFVQSWLGQGFDVDAELIETIGSGEFSSSPAGRYLQSLRDHFDGRVLADMLCLLRLHAELSIRAKGVMMLREKGFAVPPDPEVTEKLSELVYLKKSIGKTGELALAPVLRSSAHDLWQFRMLESGRA